MTTTSIGSLMSALAERVHEWVAALGHVLPQALLVGETSARDIDADRIPELDEAAYWAWTSYGYW